MRVFVQSALVGAPKKDDKIYTDSHAGSRQISSNYHWLKKIDNQSALNPHLQIHFHPSTSTN
jgi:adenine-specific DNA methylase